MFDENTSGVYLPSKEIIRYLGSFHWPPLAIISIPSLHILLA